MRFNDAVLQSICFRFVVDTVNNEISYLTDEAYTQRRKPHESTWICSSRVVSSCRFTHRLSFYNDCADYQNAYCRYRAIELFKKITASHSLQALIMQIGAITTTHNAALSRRSAAAEL